MYINGNLLLFSVSVVVLLLLAPRFIKTRKNVPAWITGYFFGLISALYGLLYGFTMMMILYESRHSSFLDYLRLTYRVVTTRYHDPRMLSVVEPFLLMLGNALVIPVFIMAISRIRNQKNE